jgi:predicted ferric reductase
MRHDQDMIWVAGGIGITPFLSLVKHESVHPSGRRIHLIWVIKNESDAFHDQELREEMKRNPQFTYVHWFSDTQGRITTKDVLEIVGGKTELTSRLIFMCGPPGLMYSLCKGFHKMKISYRHIIHIYIFYCFFLNVGINSFCKTISKMPPQTTADK